VQVDASNVRALLDLRHKVDPADSHLLHTVRIALRNQLVRDENYKRVGKIDEADARAIADVSLGVKTSASARFLVGHIQENRYPMERLSEFVHHVARYGETGDVQSLVRFCSAHEPKNLSAQSALLRAVERGTQERGRALSAETKIWVGELIGRLVKSERDQDVRLGCDLIISQRVTTMEPTLLELAAKGSTPKRLAAMDALLKLDQAKHVGSVAKPLDDEAQPSDLREQLANLLARANQPQTREALLKRLPTAPATFQTTIAGALGQTREGGEALLAMIASGKASARLLQNQGLVVRLRTHRYPGFEEKLKKLTQGIAPADAKLAELIASRKKAYLAGKPDEKRGLELFAKHCANCHQIEGKGAKIGPQLDGIGLRGLERLLEDTLDPNRNVDEAFRTTQLTLESGSVVSGLLLREEGAVLVLGDAQGKEVRVEKAKVEMRHTSPMSPMPANFGEQIVEKEFVDLLAYLIAQSKKK
jgi:putative heme-binding domain-containing protein